MTIADRVKKIITDHLGIRADKVVNQASWDDLGADSLDTVEIVMRLEEEFRIEILDRDAETILTVGQAVAYVEKAIG